MEIIKAIESRRSIRGYLPHPVPKEIIREILASAMRAPSALNTQPWKMTVVTGDALDKIKRDNIVRLKAGNPLNEQRATYTGIYHQRNVELAIDIFNLMDITREDRQKRNEWLQRGFRFFDAPVALIISIDRSLSGTWALFDLGTIAQTICLTALNYGIGTCIEAQGVTYPEVIKEHTGIGANEDIIVGIAIGYPDPDYPANQLISRRASLDEVATFVGF